MNVAELVADVVMLGGALLILVAAVGVLRFDDAVERMHALSKASTLGVSLSMLGAAVAMPALGDSTSLVFATVLQAITNPVASTLLTQATYYAQGITTHIDADDDLADYLAGLPESPPAE